MPPIDLSRYLHRIRFDGEPRPTANVLAALHRRHAASIPFENLDILAGRVPALDLPRLEAKLVSQKRGGYCFEHNTLFAAALQAVGFAVTPLAARVRFRTTAILPRTHMLLLVRADGTDWLADVGFGGEGLLEPVPMRTGESRQFAWTYRITEEPGQLVLQSKGRDGWADMYSFTLEPQFPVDFEMANHYVATHPSSPFLNGVIAQLPTPETRYTLRHMEFTTDTGTTSTTRTLESDDEVRTVLEEVFGVEVPEGVRLEAANG